MASKKDQEDALGEFIKNCPKKEISKAPLPLNPVSSGYGVTFSRPQKIDPQEEPFMPITGTELMGKWSVGWEAIFDWERQKILTPEQMEWRENYSVLMSVYTQQEREEYFSQWMYRPGDAEAFEKQHGKILDGWRGKLVSKENKTSTTAPVKAAVNFFHRKGDGWNIGFAGQTAENVKHFDGFSYIANLLKNPGSAIKDKDLSVPTNILDSEVSEKEAISNGLHRETKGQPIITKREKEIIRDKWNELQDKLPEAGIEEREEIQEELEKLKPFLNMKIRNFADPNDKKRQSNITNRLNDAFTAIHNKGLTKMADHLKKNIKTDRAYGRKYTGDLSWNIIP